RGQAEAIARSIEECLKLTVPIISIVIGEGGSGGAIAIATANRVYMLEHAVYSVISPEAGASILWRDAAKAKDVATAMKITAQDLQQLGIIDGIIAEPVGGAHREPAGVLANTAEMIRNALSELGELDGAALRQQRREKFLAIGRNLA
ncbi:MAG: acetyl-CoA carboxylase carboxyl transferase subunit alpha, partial [Nitratireductor sp.]|nr:acetyl-CoA carboxylase carboxyl transferase subunit alpha [Nitratireductor sp.]